MTHADPNERTFLRFRTYCLALSVLYLVATAIGIVLLISPGLAGDFGVGPARLLGGMLAAIGIPVSFLAYIGRQMPRREGAWIFNLLVILIGFASVLLVPFGVVLLRAWLRPEMKEWYGVNVS